jgi:tetratricopeptide (TPR) repeat protein
MKKTILVLVMLLIVAVVLAGGAAFIIQLNKLNQFKRMAVLAEEKMAEKQYDEAIIILKRIYDTGRTVRSIYLLGKAYYAQEKPSEALKYFKEIEKNHPSSGYVPEAILYRGRYALEAEGDGKKAKEIFIGLLDKYPDSDVSDHALYHLARMSYDQGNIQQAKKNLEQIVKKRDSPARDEAEFLLGNINMSELKSPEPGPNDEIYTIKKGDSLWKLERKLKVPMDLLVGMNNVDPKALKIGQQLKIPRLNLTVIIDKSKRTLTLRNNDLFLKKYRVGISKNDRRVRTGDYTINSKYEKGYDYVDPDTNAVFKMGESAFPLGTRVMTLGRNLAIHGTSSPETVGTYTAKGWITLTNQDVEELYTLLRAGTPVTIKGRKLMTEELP